MARCRIAGYTWQEHYERNKEYRDIGGPAQNGLEPYTRTFEPFEKLVEEEKS